MNRARSRGTLIFSPVSRDGDRNGVPEKYPGWLASPIREHGRRRNVGEAEVKPQRSCELAPVRVAFSRSRTETIKALPVETATAENWSAAEWISVKLVLSEVTALFKARLNYSTKAFNNCLIGNDLYVTVPRISAYSVT